MQPKSLPATLLEEDKLPGMKRFLRLRLLLPLSLSTLSCQPDDDALALQASAQEFEVETLGQGLDCGLPLIEFKDQLEQVEKITGSSWGRFYAYNLPPELWQGKILKVKIRKTQDKEFGICTAMGPAYPWVTIVSARVIEKCLDYRPASVAGVVGPATGRVNEIVPLSVSFQVDRGCGQFHQFIVERVAGTTHTVQAQARYEGCGCRQVAPTLQATYPFQATHPGVYEVQFRQSDTSFVTHTVRVQ